MVVMVMFFSKDGGCAVKTWVYISGGAGPVRTLQSWLVERQQLVCAVIMAVPSLSPSVQHGKMKFLCIATKTSIEVYAWAQKPYSKFMQYKSFPDVPHRPLLVDMVCETPNKTKVLYASSMGRSHDSHVMLLCIIFFSFPGFHAIDLENGVLQDIYLPSVGVRSTVTPHAIIPLPRSTGELLLCYNSEGEGEGGVSEGVRERGGSECECEGEVGVREGGSECEGEREGGKMGGGKE